MDRRQFLAASGLAAAVPAFTNATEAGAKAEAGLFKRTDFTADGLGLDPREYSLLLQRRAASGALQPDNYSNGGLVAQLEQKFAQLLGKQAAMFVPTGTLANHLAVRTLAGNDRRVLVQAESHLYNDSGDCAQSLSGLHLVPLAEGRGGISLDEARRWVERTAHGRVEMKVGAISIETPLLWRAMPSSSMACSTRAGCSAARCRTLGRRWRWSRIMWMATNRPMRKPGAQRTS